MRMKFARVDILLIAAVAAIFYFRNWQAILFFVVVFAYAALRYYKAKKGEPPADSNEFLIEKEDETFFTAELDIGLDYRSKPNYFRTDYRFDTCQRKCLYEYRLEQTDVLCRLIENQYEDIGVPKHNDVRDGVIMESEIRKRDSESSFHITRVEDNIANLKAEIECTKSIRSHGMG